MTDGQVLSAATACRALLAPGPVAQDRGLVKQRVAYTRAAHLRYMCDSIPALVAVGDREKAMRWIGFIQGCLWSEGLASIEDLRKMNQ